MLAENNNESIQYTQQNGSLMPTHIFETEKKTYMGIGVYYSCKWKLDKGFAFELRPGIFNSQKIFSGAQLGIFVRKYFAEEYLMALGAVSELHLGDGGHTYDPTTITGTIGLMVGRKIFDNFLLHVSFNKPVNSKYGKMYSTTNKKTYGYLHSVFKFGIEVGF
jgi:hypothetical protein